MHARGSIVANSHQHLLLKNSSFDTCMKKHPPRFVAQRALSGAAASTSGHSGLQQLARALSTAAPVKQAVEAKRGAQHGGGDGVGSPATTMAAAAAAAAPAGGGGSYEEMALTQRCRYDVAFHEILYRELMLKINPRAWTGVPKLRSVTLTVSTREDTRTNRDDVTRDELLLHLLALETLARAPAHFVAARMQGRTSGVAVSLTGQLALDFLEKLVYMVLPNQIGFEGASHPVEIPTPEAMWAAVRSAGGAGGAATTVAVQQQGSVPTGKAYASELKITNLMLFPDFEQNFEMFEPLRSMQVRIEVDNAPSADVARLLLSGFALPVRAPEVEEEEE
ncbi:hypothetical protein FOA52_003095 [Chlamydomonas sp. UWO 241]|nr:hypothetical protein FOA52_003095 [Chlamydomonas sp. UWO 241]